jgi:hypothetical protein
VTARARRPANADPFDSTTTRGRRRILATTPRRDMCRRSSLKSGSEPGVTRSRGAAYAGRVGRCRAAGPEDLDGAPPSGVAGHDRERAGGCPGRASATPPSKALGSAGRPCGPDTRRQAYADFRDTRDTRDTRSARSARTTCGGRMPAANISAAWNRARSHRAVPSRSDHPIGIPHATGPHPPTEPTSPDTSRSSKKRATATSRLVRPRSARPVARLDRWKVESVQPDALIPP